MKSAYTDFVRSKCLFIFVAVLLAVSYHSVIAFSLEDGNDGYTGLKTRYENNSRTPWVECTMRSIYFEDQAKAEQIDMNLHNPEIDEFRYYDFNADNDTEIVDEILRLLELGDREIELSTQKDIILVAGMSGSGKSTLAQLVAGDYYELEAIKGDEGYYIKDRNGTISNQTIISKTLLPNLVIEKITETAFYDLPGFSDTRNASVEIANAFFIKKVADHGERLKVIIVAIGSTFKSANRNAFLDLLKQLVLFMKDVRKMTAGLSIIGTMVDTRTNDVELMREYKAFFEKVKQDLPMVWTGPDLLPLVPSALSLIDALITTNADGDLTNIGVFRTPWEEGFLDDMPVFQCTKRNMKNLIWNNTDYIAKVEQDIGYGLSPQAQNLIMKLVAGLDKKIRNALEEITLDLKTKLTSMLDSVDPSNTDFVEELQTTLRVVLDSRFPLCNNATEENLISPRIYMTEILDNLETFDNLVQKDDISRLTNMSSHLDFFKNASEDSAVFYPREWVKPFNTLNAAIQTYVENVLVGKIDKYVSDKLRQFEGEASAELEQSIEMIAAGNLTGIHELQTVISNLSASQYPLCNRTQEELEPPAIYTNEIITNIESFTQGNLFTIVRSALTNSSLMLEFYKSVSSGTITFDPKSWILPLSTLKTGIQSFLKNGFATKINAAIVNELKSLSTLTFETKFKEDLIAITSSTDPAHIEQLQHLLKNLFAAAYPFCITAPENEGELKSATEYTNEIITNINLFGIGSFDQELKALENNGFQLDFFKNATESSILFYPKEWVDPLITLKATINAFIQNTLVSEANKNVVDTLKNYKTNTEAKIQVGIGVISSGNLTGLIPLQNQIVNLYESTYPLCNRTHDVLERPVVYMNEIIDNMKTFSDGSVTSIVITLSDATFLIDFYRNVSAAPVTFDPKSWIEPLGELRLAIQGFVRQGQVSKIDQGISDGLESLSDDFLPEFKRRLDALISSDDLLLNLLKNLLGAVYPKCISAPTDATTLEPPSVYIEEISSNIQAFGVGTYHPQLLSLANNGSKLEFFKFVSDGKILFTPKNWIRDLSELSTDVQSYIDKVIAPKIYNQTHSSLNGFYHTLRINAIIYWNHINDIVIKKNKLEEWDTKMVEIEERLRNQMNDPKLDEFILLVISTGREMDFNITSDMEKNLKSYFPVINFVHGLGSFPWNTNAWDWIAPFKILHEEVQNELYYVDQFLIPLSNGLAKMEIQVDQQYDVHLWWTQNKNVNSSNFDSFWVEFEEIRSGEQKRLKDILAEVITRYDSLNLLLETMLVSDVVCTSANITSPISKCHGLFVRISDVKKVINAHTNVVALLGYHTAYIDDHIEGSNLNKTNLDMFIMAPKWNSKERTLDLTGASGPSPDPPQGNGERPGVPGKPGRKAGNLIGIGEQFTNLANLIVRLDGGRGGSGQTGQTGMRGKDGTEKEFTMQCCSDEDKRQIVESECHAKKGGNIWVKVYPHRCGGNLHDGPYTDPCHANDEGATVELYGHPGTKGGNGGPGGKGGLGGPPGLFSLLDLGLGKPRNSNGKGGSSGEVGQGGDGGVGGNHANSKAMSIDDRSDGNVECEIIRRDSDIIVDDPAPKGDKGLDGGNDQNPDVPEKQTFNPILFQIQYIEEFKLNVIHYQQNEYIRYILTQFIAKLPN